MFELLDASGDFFVVQSTCTALLVQSHILQYQVAEGRGLVEQSSKTGFSPASGGSKEERESERKAATESAYSAPRQYGDPGC